MFSQPKFITLESANREAFDHDMCDLIEEGYRIVSVHVLPPVHPISETEVYYAFLVAEHEYVARGN